MSELSELARIDLSAREPLTSEITRRLLDYLLSGTIEPGDRMPSERKLAEALGVGRSIVRQAIKSLTVLGLIDVRQGDGTYLRRTDSPFLPVAIEWGLLLGVKRVTDLVEARHYLEVVIAGLAAERRGEAELSEMRRTRRCHGRDDRSGCIHGRRPGIPRGDGSGRRQRDAAADHDEHPHAAPGLDQARRLQLARTRVRRRRSIMAVLRAIEAGDAKAAQAAMEGHMAHATERLERTLAEHEDAEDRELDPPPGRSPAPRALTTGS